jgi:hypothetical protein
MSATSAESSLYTLYFPNFYFAEDEKFTKFSDVCDAAKKKCFESVISDRGVIVAKYSPITGLELIEPDIDPPFYSPRT